MRRALWAVLVASLVLAGACSGDDGGPGAEAAEERSTATTSSTSSASTTAASLPATPVTKEQFIARGDPLCAEVRAELEAAEVPSALPALAEYLEKSIATNADLQAKLRALQPERDAEASAVLDAFDALLAAVEEARDAAARGDDHAFNAALGEISSAQVRMSEAAGDYGFRSCGVD